MNQTELSVTDCQKGLIWYEATLQYPVLSEIEINSKDAISVYGYFTVIPRVNHSTKTLEKANILPKLVWITMATANLILGNLIAAS